jgi:hypothetical protein
MEQVNMKNIILIGIIAFLTGCAGGNLHQLYTGEHLKDTRHAVLKPWEKEIPQESSESRFVLILSIDGEETELPSADKISQSYYFVSPGEHVVKVSLFANVSGNKMNLKNPEPMTFIAKADHTYVTKAFLAEPMQGDIETKVKLSFWLEDENTGEVVSGTKLTE